MLASESLELLDRILKDAPWLAVLMVAAVVALGLALIVTPTYVLVRWIVPALIAKSRSNTETGRMELVMLWSIVEQRTNRHMLRGAFTAFQVWVNSQGVECPDLQPPPDNKYDTVIDNLQEQLVKKTGLDVPSSGDNVFGKPVA